ncbi:flagellar hook-associated protein FlgK [Cytobacillus suaedae]|nr:flagellar hook-associated protein FlgK [Cytobacillus suaedae]
MRSTFHGLETARRGMVTQQSALHTTGHNISNANTPGYARQRVNFNQTNPYPSAAMNRPQIPGQMGTGVEAGTVQRIREGFLDTQYRNENSKLGYWDARAKALQSMEEIMNEPSESGLAKTMDRFWQSLQDLAVNPEDAGARSVVKQRGIAVGDTFNYLSSSLKAIQEDLGTQIEVTKKAINSISTQIGEINKQISEIEPHGYLPNDLYDQRDLLIDELSKYVEVKIDKVPSSGKPLEIAEGIYNVSIFGEGPSDSTTLITIVDGIEAKQINEDTTPGINVVGSVTPIPLKSKGELKGLLESYHSVYPLMIDDLDKMAYSFATRFNEVHAEGFTLKTSSEDSKPGGDFFNDLGLGDDAYKGAASKINVSSDIDNLNNIAASSVINEAGNGQNALSLSEVKNSNFASLTDPTPDAAITYPIEGGTIQSFYESVIGKMGIDSQEATRLSNNVEVLRQSVDGRRQSVMGVSIDEEMTNMIKYQHAYNASARNITVIDEMLDKIINGMGVVGR